MAPPFAEGGPFDPDDPLDVLTDSYRRQIIDMALRGPVGARYQSISSMDKFAALAGGVAAGLVAVALAQVKPEGHGAMMRYLADCLDYGRRQFDVDRPPLSTTGRTAHSDGEGA